MEYAQRAREATRSPSGRISVVLAFQGPRPLATNKRPPGDLQRTSFKTNNLGNARDRPHPDHS